MSNLTDHTPESTDQSINAPATPAPEPASTEEAPTNTSKKNIIIGAAIAVVAVAIGYAAFFTDTFGDLVSFNSKTVATVNGVSITRVDFENSLKNVKNSITAQGADPEDPNIQEVVEGEALKQLINTQLLLQAAAEAGYEVDEEELEKQMMQLEINYGGTEQLENAMSELGITQDMLREDVGEQMLVNQYLEHETEIAKITASDEEVEAFYENLKPEFGDELPPLDDIREPITKDILEQKQRGMLGSILANLRAQAEVEIKM